MDDYTSSVVSVTRTEEDMDLRRGPWTMEEDIMLANYIAKHGEGRWNSLARCAGLRRSGKSCRLRWLNYLRPDIRRGNITLEEQLLILELHSSWGNRWSKIAQYLPGRTDNEIKNFWRTRVQKQAKQLRCDVNSTQFKDAMRYLSMPILLERIQATSAAKSAIDIVIPSSPVVDTAKVATSFTPEHSINSMMTQRQVSSGSDLTADFEFDYSHSAPNCESPHASIRRPESLSPSFFDESLEFSITEPDAWSGGDTFGNTWNIEDIWHLEQHCDYSLPCHYSYLS